MKNTREDGNSVKTMPNKNLLGTLVEICLIVIISATAGIAWNRSLLTGAWRGELTQQAQAAPRGEELPMPIGLAQVKEMHDAKQAVIVDARSAESFAHGHIAGATILPLEAARKNPSIKFPGPVAKDAVIIVYCNGFSCHDSMDLGKLLMQAGYSAVYVYEGGFPEWRDAGYPIAKGGV
jgi:rhodanese-related sulfurtransferase